MLVNAGVYRERGLGEPALAALIQQDVGANPALVSTSRHGTFSFDIGNGVCGALTGLDVLRGFLDSQAIQLGAVVASDSGPDPRHARSLPRPEAGGAILLALDEAVEGLSPVCLRTFPEHESLLQGYWEWTSAARHRARGTNRLVVLERPGFAARASECAAEVVTELLQRSGVRPEQVDLVIASPAPDFADQLAELIEIEPTRVLHVGEHLGRMHSAQPIAAIDHARRTGRWDAAHTILLVSAGSGITIATALYRH
jgi:3-oxoacyl-[acyl-carrier-protein] synthase-3